MPLIQWSLLLLALLLAGCTAPPPRPANLPEVPLAFKEAESIQFPSAESQPRGEWWKVFADPLLDALIERAQVSNTSIQRAAARLAQARSLARTAGANRLPQAGFNAGASRQGGPLINAAGADGALFNIGSNLSYELDLIGRLANTEQAATLDARSHEALLQSTRLLVQAEITQTYLALRAIDGERSLMRATIAALSEGVRLVHRRLRAGLGPDMDVARAQAEAAATEAELIALDRRRAELEHALGFLTGGAPSTVRIEETDWRAALPVIPPGIPSAVLARRPDVAAAERAMAAAQKRLGVAHTAWFPNLTLTASGGHAASELGELFRLSARAWGIGALLALPLFDGGRREANIQSADADLELALTTYREQILVAFRDVEDQLSALRLLAQQTDALASAVEGSTRAASLAESRYRKGLVSQLEPLDAQRTALRNRRTALAVQSLRYQATVGLIRALGGGWGELPK